LVSILALSILCSAIGFTGQTEAPKYTTPIHTDFIFSLETVFSALFAFIFVGVLPAKGYLGQALS
jgi:drug/metabolite transporter (DMT)-like permease